MKQTLTDIITQTTTKLIDLTAATTTTTATTTTATTTTAITALWPDQKGN